jgi:hypothetical protein
LYRADPILAIIAMTALATVERQGEDDYSPIKAVILAFRKRQAWAGPLDFGLMIVD